MLKTKSSADKADEEHLNGAQKGIDSKNPKKATIKPQNVNFHENPTVDGRKLRRIIAEDPEWNLMTVPMLTDLCINTIVRNFATYPRHDELLEKYRRKVLKKLPTTLPLKITSNLIDSEEYWQRCCKNKWKLNDSSKYGNSWKRMYFERELQDIIENFVPNQTDKTKLTEIVDLGMSLTDSSVKSWHAS
jgi:hypothetical protein